MTRSEAINLLSQMRKDGDGFLSDNTIEAYDMGIEALQKEPCEEAISREAVMHILDEVGGDFDSPREAVVPVDYIADMVSDLPSVSPQPCDDCISRQAVNELVDELARAISDERCCISRGRSTATIMRDILYLPPVTPQPEVGRWIYDKNIDNWKCSECGETPKTMGYCGSAAFMAEHFKYCNHCGAKMQEVEND